MDEKLKKATEIFDSLGWNNVTAENIMTLPVGTPEQKKAALQGLKSGAWRVYTTSTAEGYHFFPSEYANKLALYAVRIGVTVSRASEIVNIFQANKDMLYHVVESRGKKFASDYVMQLTRFGIFIFRDETSKTGSIEFLMRLINEMNLDIPQNVNYINCWTSLAAAAMGVFRRYDRNNDTRPSLELIQKRFAEHIMAGVALNAPATAGFATVAAKGVHHGFLAREEAIKICLTALDASVRPGDRAAWLDALDILEIRDEELVQRIQSLIPLLSLGDAKVIERLAPTLITNADESTLTDVLLSAFSAPTKKSKILLLKTAIARESEGTHKKIPEGATNPCRPENLEELAPWLSIFASDSDKTIATLAQKLAAKWNINAEAFPEEEMATTGLWQPTPSIWQVPDFEIGQVSPEALTEVLVKVAARSNETSVHDVVTEQLYALINAVARISPEDARASLRGISKNSWSMREISCWVQGIESMGSDEAITNRGLQPRIKTPLHARNYVVAKNFGKLPCILSTPSKADLTITAPDLVTRLESYKKENIDAQEGDLFVAITRLDLNTVTSETREALKKLNIPVQLQSSQHMSLTAGQAVLNYIDNPIKEPDLEIYSNSYWRSKPFENVEKALGAFPDRLGQNTFGSYLSDYSSIFPTFGDAALNAKLDGYSDSEKLPRLPQAARRATPLPPKASMDMLASLSYAKLQAAEDVLSAITKAWERGLLRPGVADIKHLGRAKSPPSNLASLATSFDTIARSGMLSVVWPIMDEIVCASLAAPRLLPGTAEFCEIIAAFIPEVNLAIENNIADKSALDLPGIRTLAMQGGSSRAVTAAKKVVALLPEATTQQGISGSSEAIPGMTFSATTASGMIAPGLTDQEMSANTMKPPFDEVWPQRSAQPHSQQESQCEILDDGATLTIDWSASENKHFLFRLIFPGKPWQEYQIVEPHSISHYGYGRTISYINAYPADIGAPYQRVSANQVRLHWNTEKNALVAKEREHWKELTELTKAPKGEISIPLSSSLITIVIGLIAQDGDISYSVTRTVNDLIATGQLNDSITKAAVKTLLQNTIVSPAKLTRLLEKDVTLLPIMYPILTEGIKAAGESVSANDAGINTTGGPTTAAAKNPPPWLNRILDTVLRYAPYLKEAANHNLLSPEDAAWPGLAEIAAMKSKSTAVSKAKKILEIMNGNTANESRYR